MRTMQTKRVTFALAIVLAVVFVLLVGFSAASGVAHAAEGTPALESEITIGHMSDIHYFPLEYCYQDVANEKKYKASDFYHSMTGDTKLVLESGMVFNKAMHEILADAEEHKAPQYLIASGDLCKNGERVALIDVANMFRWLQEEMRKKDGYENFQVFVTTGNHDLYNNNGALYSHEDGSERVADMVTAAQFAMIFAGLGYPNASLDGANGTFNLTSYMPADYWSSEYTNGYVTSKNASNLNISYYSEELNAIKDLTTDDEKLEKYYKVGDGLGVLTYFAELTDKQGFSFILMDSSDREPSKNGVPVRISQSEYDSFETKPELFLDDGNGVINTKKAVSADTAFSQTAKNVYRKTPLQHITGGRITTECLDWIESEIKSHNTTTLNEETYVASCHHNILPHFEQEDDILKDFTAYNWEYTAKRLLNMGVRYVLTGHMHASDAMSYTDAEGRTLYDFETGSTISYASPRRYMTLTRNNCDGKLGEQLTSSIYVLDDLKEVPSNHIANPDSWNQTAFEAAYAAYNADKSEANWNALVETNPDYLTYIIRYDLLSKLNYNEYISQDIYTIIVERMIDHFINMRLIDSAKSAVENAITVTFENFLTTNSYSWLTGEIFTAFDPDDFVDDAEYDEAIHDASFKLGITTSTLNKAVQYLIDTAINGLYPDSDSDGNAEYPYDGKTYANAIDYVRAIIDKLLDLEFGDASIASTVNEANAGKLNIRQIASFILMAHSAGMEISLDETPESVAEHFDEIDIGESKDYYRFMQPNDKVYRQRMLAAMKDLHAQLVSGQFVDTLLDTVLDPLFNDDNSLLKTLLDFKFDFSKAITAENPKTKAPYLTAAEYEEIRVAFIRLPIVYKFIIGNEVINPVINGFLADFGLNVTLPKELPFTLNPEAFCLGDIIDSLIPIAKPIIADLLGFNMEGDTLVKIVENMLDGYVTPSFLVGLGGIADNIIMALATDVYPDLADMKNPSAPLLIQPNKDYKYGGVSMSYVSTLNKVSSVGAAFNAATQDNGRVPSRVTANFDTKNPTTKFTFKFYTDEDVYGTFKYKTSPDGEWISLSTSKENADPNSDYFESVATATVNGITVSMVTETKPVYLPLIDLGLACITHAEIEDGDDVPYKYGERDKAEKNSIVYKNVTTVTVSGLTAATTYYYDLEGIYVNGDVTASFSLAENSKTKGYDKDYFTFTTAADKNTTSFEFLTIADIQGMIQGMYDDSYAAVKALLANDATKNFNFILNAGDMCDNGKNYGQWGMALNTYQELFANSSQFFTAGNHESGTNALINYFNYSRPVNAENKLIAQNTKDGVFYSFDYGNAHFVVLNTNDANSQGLGATQLEWLKNDLANTDSKWKFVLMHKSIYSGGSHSTDAEVVAMREQLVPIFNEYGVNIVFGGHDHTYASTYLLDKNGNVVKKNIKDGVQYTGDGVLFITLGTMGTKFYTYKENPDTTSKFDENGSICDTLDSQTFGKVTVDGDTITFKSYYYNRETGEIEEFGSKALTAKKPVNVLAITLGVVIPVVVIAAVVTTLLVLNKKGLLKKKAKPEAEIKE